MPKQQELNSMQTIEYAIKGTADPTVTAQNMPAGSLYLKTGAPIALYQKQDAGSTTNFEKIALSDATDIVYAPTTPADWVAPPNDAAEALDKLSAGIKVFTSAASVGGAATEAYVVTGLLASDQIISITQKASAVSPLNIESFGAPGANALSVTYNADPGAGSTIVVAVKRF